MNVLYFHADWCMNCRMLEPLIKRMSERGTIKVEDVDSGTEDGMQIAQSYNVSSLPTLIFLRGGTEVNRLTGVIGEFDILKVLGE